MKKIANNSIFINIQRVKKDVSQKLLKQFLQLISVSIKNARNNNKNLI